MSGLAFASAPRPSLPMRFLVAALAWGAVAGLWLAWQGEIALLSRDCATAEAPAAEAWLLAPKDPATRALKATLDFRHPQTRAGAVEMARGVLAETPDNVAASMVLIAEKMNAGAPAEALPLIDTALAIAPKDEGLRLARLTALERLGDTAGAGAEIRRMAELFPDDPGVRQALIQWYLQADDPDGAMAFTRHAEPLTFTAVPLATRSYT